MERRIFMIQGLNSKDSADRICEELKKIVGIHKIEICFETEQMIIEADSLSMPRIINAVITITHILDYRVTIIEVD